MPVEQRGKAGADLERHLGQGGTLAHALGFERFGQALADMPEVLEAYLLTGEYDYLIKVAVAGTAGYEQFLRRKLYKLPGLRHSRSTFVLRVLKSSHAAAP